MALRFSLPRDISHDCLTRPRAVMHVADAIIAAVTMLACSRCTGPRDDADNFCRRCGHQFAVALPAVRSVNLPERREQHGLPPSIVGSVALLALGTGAEWLARRLAGTAARTATKAVLGRGRNLPAKSTASSPQDVTVDEVLYIRKVQLHR
jgi:hypothetical protein